MPKEKVEIIGLQELAHDFSQLPRNLRERSLKRAARKSGNLIRDRAKAKVPSRTGKLRDSITATVRLADLFTIEAEIGPRRKQGWYAHFVEFGHKLVRRGRLVGNVAAKPFLRPAADQSTPEVINIVTTEVDKEVERFNRKK